MPYAPIAAAVGGRPFMIPALESRIVEDPTNPNAYRIDVKLYNAGSALTLGGVYEVFAGGIAATAPNPRVQAIGGTVSNRQRIFCVALSAAAATAWDWFTIQGNCTALCEGGTDIAAGDILKPVADQIYLVQDHATVATVSGIAIAHEAYTTASAALKAIYLIGNPASI